MDSWINTNEVLQDMLATYEFTLQTHCTECCRWQKSITTWWAWKKQISSLQEIEKKEISQHSFNCERSNSAKYESDISWPSWDNALTVRRETGLGWAMQLAFKGNYQLWRAVTECTGTTWGCSASSAQRSARAETLRHQVVKSGIAAAFYHSLLKHNIKSYYMKQFTIKY